MAATLFAVGRLEWILGLADIPDSVVVAVELVVVGVVGAVVARVAEPFTIAVGVVAARGEQAEVTFVAVPSESWSSWWASSSS